MKNLLGMSYDITDAITAGEIEYLAELTNGQDDLVKNAHVASIEEVEEMPAENFALILYHPHAEPMKKFATTDRYITELNIRMLKDKSRILPDEIVKMAASNLEKAAKHFRIPFPAELKGHKTESNILDITHINKTAWIKKQASLRKDPEIVYALPDKKRYPLNTGALVKTAMQYFDTHKTRFTPAEALEFAINTKTAALKFSIDTTSGLTKYSSLDTTQLNPDFATHLTIRKTYATENFHPVYDELLEKVSTIPLLKLARVLEELDKEAKIDRFWNHGIEDPIFTVYPLKKEANCSHKGKKVTRASLKKMANTDIIDRDTIKELQGEDGLAIFESLPRPIKDKLVDLL